MTNGGDWQGEALRYRRRGQSTMEFRWTNYGTGLALRNLRQEDGHIYADLHAYVLDREANRYDRILVRPKVNITSGRSIGPTKKELVEAAGNACDWSQFLESVVSILVDEMDTKGESTWLIPLERAQLAQPMLFRNFVPEGLVSGLQAHGGTGKSMTALLMTLAIATGQKIGPFEPLKQGVVLYIDWENQWDLHSRRLTRICHGLGMDFPRDRILHHRVFSDLRHAEAELIELAYEHGAVLSILDSIGFAAGGNLNDSEIATQSVNVMKHIPGTKLMIAHVSKSVVNGIEKSSATGSVFFWNGPQATYDLHVTEPEMDGSIILSVYQGKANVGAKLKRPLGVRVEFHEDDSGGPIIPLEHEIKGHAAGGEGLPVGVRILDLLEVSGALTADEIVDALFGEEQGKARKDSVMATLRSLRAKGVVHSTGDGRKGDSQKWSSQPNGQAAPNDTFACNRCGKPADGYDNAGRPVCGEHL